MRGGGDDHRAAARHRHQSFELDRIGRRRRHIELEIARRDHIAGAERGKPLGIGLRLGQAKVETAEQRGDRAGHAAPARERARRHPSIDHDHRHPPGGAGEDQIGPEVGFDEQPERWAPMIQKPLHKTWRVIGDVLMDHIRRETFGHDRGRGHRSRGEQDADVERAQPLDQRRRRQHLADARAVNPDQRSERARVVAQAAAFVGPLRIFLAVLEPLPDQGRRKRRRRRGQPAVHAQGHRERVSHWTPPSRAAGRHPGGQRSDRRGACIRSAWLRGRGAPAPSPRRRHRAAR